ARHLLESCDRLFLDNAKEVFRKEVQNIHDCKDALEKMISSERIQWAVERENMELQLDRFRHQIEQFPNVQKEKAILRSELSATRTQIEQYRLRLRQKCEEVERLEAERDALTALAKEIQRLDQESQDQIREANTVIDELERKLKDTSADLERPSLMKSTRKKEEHAYIASLPRPATIHHTRKHFWEWVSVPQVIPKALSVTTEEDAATNGHGIERSDWIVSVFNALDLQPT
ncbi:hypothetical protein ANCDUO_22888, partial [Ancylostoma duodenale]